MDSHAVISLVGYRVNEIDFKINQKFKEEDIPIKLDIDFDVNIKIDNEKYIASVLLGCIINNDYEINNKPFLLYVTVEGIFTFESSIDEELLVNLLNKNTVAIVFPYLRATISTISVNCGINAVILPTINVVEFLKAKGSDNSIQGDNLPK